MQRQTERQEAGSVPEVGEGGLCDLVDVRYEREGGGSRMIPRLRVTSVGVNVVEREDLGVGVGEEVQADDNDFRCIAFEKLSNVRGNVEMRPRRQSGGRYTMYPLCGLMYKYIS